MPPLFTSTSWTTIIRKIATVMVYSPKPAIVISGGARAAPKRTINNLQKTRQAINQVINQSFPSISTPSHQLNHATIPIKTSARGFTSFSTSNGSYIRSARNGPVRQNIQNSGSRPKWRNGPAIQANIGLGKARTFASAPAQSMLHGNIPIVLRAFASLLDDENKHGNHKYVLPRASRYTPYSREKFNRREKRRVSCKSIDSSFIEDLKHYFPLSCSTEKKNGEEEVVQLPLTPETLVTEGKITVLALPLSPSLEALLSPTAQLPYHDTSIGISILARLTQGLLPIHEAFSIHSSTRIIPLLTKLDGLGVLDYHPGSARTESEVVHDSNGQPDILRLIFNDRSISDVKLLLGESLRSSEEGQWWCLYEDQKLDLTSEERNEMIEQWGSPIIKPTVSRTQIQSEQLIFPTLDVSVNTLGDDQSGVDVLFDASESIVSTPSEGEDSWPSTGMSTPFVDPISSSASSTSISLTASLLSRLSESESNLSYQGTWSVHPSDSDSDIESAFAESEEWAQVDQMLSPSDHEQDQREEGSVLVNWSGSGQGFGFLAQPW
ncbi:uncharacterized protein IL334_002442 [Kwoniella shivajii]|uniref:Uncharacterized protein n=1 Tax=Kwoniella shivajii TaxID=564305 RepID=A0ABZ1CUR8_9TREE|nr:hypothetical protein IL334_002442 [Kwoniella shivajii]